MGKTISLKDVARVAGVSLGTASKVVNGTGKVNAEMRAKVLQTIKELDYVPNIIARSLKTKLNHTVGVIIPEISNPFFTSVVNGIEEVLQKQGYSMLLYNTNLNTEEELRALLVFNQKVDGIIFISNTISDVLAQELRKLSIPLVLIATQLEGVISLNIDNEEAAYTAVNHLYELGHRKIAILSGLLNDKNAGAPRLAGYKKALQEKGLPINPLYIKEGNYKFKDGYDNALALMALKERPSAIFAASDLMCMGACRAILSLGHQIPEDVALIGFDDIEFSQYFNPPITTVRQPRDEMGKAGSEFLVSLIRQKQVEPKNYIFDFELVIRESSERTI